MRTVLRQCLLICAAGVGAMTVFTLLFPELFFHLHGVYAIPKDGVMSLRLYSLCFVTEGFDSIFQLYFINRKESGFSSLLALINGVSLVVISFLFAYLLPPPYVGWHIWLSRFLFSVSTCGVTIPWEMARVNKVMRNCCICL
jgi:O-antigen/teichoic acid export membrane protein